MIMIFPGLLFALLLNARVQGAVAAVSPVHPWGCHFPRAPAAPLAGFPKAPLTLTAPLQPEPTHRAGVGKGSAADQPLPRDPLQRGFSGSGCSLGGSESRACASSTCSAGGGSTRAMPLGCAASWHGMRLQGAGATLKQEHHSSVAAPPGTASPAHPLQPRLGTWPLCPCPLSPLARPGSALCA